MTPACGFSSQLLDDDACAQAVCPPQFYATNLASEGTRWRSPVASVARACARAAQQDVFEDTNACTWQRPQGVTLRPSLVAGAGFEPADPRLSNLLTAHDFWSQVLHQQRVIGLAFVLARPLVFSPLLLGIGDIVETGPLRSGVPNESNPFLHTWKSAESLARRKSH